MLKYIAISNFQSHNQTTVELSPKINVIIGDSNVGKTSILRAINWVLKNRPLGNNFIRLGTKEAAVNLLFDKNGESVSIERVRSKGTTNEYKIQSKESITFTAFGNSPPQLVLDVLNLSDVNIQGQFDPYFLVFESPGKIANYLRSITGLDEIDRVSDVLDSRIRTNKQDIQYIEVELEGVELKLKELLAIDLDKLEVDIVESDSLVQNVSKLQEQQAILIFIIDELTEVGKTKLDISDEDIESLRVRLEELSSQYVFDIQKRDSLLQLMEELLDLSDKKVDIPADLSKFDVVNQLVDGYNISRREVNNLCDLIKDIEESRKKDLSGEILELTKEIACLKMNLTVCPTCGQELNEEAKSKLLEEYNK